MIDPTGYAIVAIRNRTKTKKKNDPVTHPVMMAIMQEEDTFDNLVDALIEKSKRKNPTDYIVIPYWK